MRSFEYGGEPVFIDFSVVVLPTGPARIYDENLTPRMLAATERLLIDSIYIDMESYVASGYNTWLTAGVAGQLVWEINADNTTLDVAGFTSRECPTGLSLPVGVYPYTHIDPSPLGVPDGAAFCGTGRIVRNS